MLQCVGGWGDGDSRQKSDDDDRQKKVWEPRRINTPMIWSDESPIL
jgi:hypothetical protein